MPQNKPDASLAWKQMEDLLVPRLRLGVYEHIVYAHLLRHSRLQGRRRVHFSMNWLARGILTSTLPARRSVRSLAVKGILRIIERSRAGHIVEVLLPNEIAVCRREPPVPPDAHLEAVDFLHSRKYRNSILRREGNRCFYCQRFLRPRALALDHVVPRVQNGRNSYRNLVACCTDCNSRKADRDAEDLLRILFRQGRLNATELADSRRALKALAAGKLRPALNESLVHPACPERSRGKRSRGSTLPTIGKRGRPRLHPAVS
jgi:5-methylcytosine-specific restriction endonuclease McrA